ncbi:hypothetical protein CLAFUW4_06129 [Fulvia fulva]|uniref:Uncharacterized protein n=1 Tax=Passalora fulva TaxID=5499 RepID=A0A9Q8LHI4_PASFU|nr:uncharacterized protein CLAFUR5_06273 [Fulvia fulva]KAK4623972.1 hypothetical protein CLAFUR4_06133 [Fulvia fulva]KAK4625244.1 hypothetical protein CLAFUR0_06137 [Fulvia fulva]UJO17485.1 hypothetical protein CLAFUR5_06273 [Fulvia fulva]WPV15083.1 hypothetical protein CLAFUW4_06129 [Fulvia fulva]WPV29972.1 hypothetical protein CLAFUW7_06126 [Fulvia fulva]
MAATQPPLLDDANTLASDGTTSNTSGMDSLAPDQGTCHFFRLPRELRDEVYRLAFTGTSVYTAGTSTGFTRHQRRDGFLLTCKRLHPEALESYYTNVEFVVTSMNVLHQWLSRLPVMSRQRIRSIGCGPSMFHLDRPLRWGGWPDPEAAMAGKRRQLEYFRQLLAKEGIVIQRGVLKVLTRQNGHSESQA